MHEDRRILRVDLFSSVKGILEHDKEYRRRLDLTIFAAVLLHSSSIHVSARKMRFGNEKEPEESVRPD